MHGCDLSHFSLRRRHSRHEVISRFLRRIRGGVDPWLLWGLPPAADEWPDGLGEEASYGLFLLEPGSMVVMRPGALAKEYQPGHERRLARPGVSPRLVIYLVIGACLFRN